jgi:hypothetical protein
MRVLIARSESIDRETDEVSAAIKALDALVKGRES